MEWHTIPVSKVLSGVPQGSVVGPLLFLIYVNDIHLNIHSTVRLYADDMVLYRQITCLDDSVILQNDLLSLCDWCNRWQMEINVSKTKCMSLTRSKRIITSDYTVEGVQLDRVTVYKYLGVHICNDLSWKYHIEQTCCAALRTLGFLRSTLYLASSEVKFLAYASFVRSKLEYASSIWSPWQNYLVQKLESVQSKAVRFIFNKYDRESSITEFKRQKEIPLLANRRKIHRLQIIYNLYDRNSDYLSAAPPYSERTRHPHTLFVPLSRTEYHKNSPLLSGVRDWNMLPSDVFQGGGQTRFVNMCEELYLF